MLYSHDKYPDVDDKHIDSRRLDIIKRRTIHSRNSTTSGILVTYDYAEKIMIFTVQAPSDLMRGYVWNFAIIDDPSDIYNKFHCTDFINPEGATTVDNGWYLPDYGNKISFSVRVKNSHIPKSFDVTILWVASKDAYYDGWNYKYTPPKYIEESISSE